MNYYPLLLDLKGKKCVVIGGGKVAERKAVSLLKSGAVVMVVSPGVTKTLALLKSQQRIRCIIAHYHKKFLKGAFLAIIATDDQQLNRKAAGDSQRAGILTNVVDSPALSNFIVPSVIAKKGLIISISTSGQVPALSKRIRKDITSLLIPSYAQSLTILKRIRRELKKKYTNPKTRARILKRLVNIKI